MRWPLDDMEQDTNPSPYGSLAGFGQHLVDAIALPELATGYASLVQHFRRQEHLAGLAKEQGIDALLAGRGGELSGLQKSNKELVTVAEKVAERSMTQAVQACYPDHAIVGEEHGHTQGNQTRWVFDPVDGTSAMIRTAMAEAFGVPLAQPRPSFGITVAVVEGDEAVLGIVAELRPRGGELRAVHCWIGEKGQPSTVDGRAIALPHAPATLARATLASTVPTVMFNTAERWSRYQALAQATRASIADQNCIGFMRILQVDGGIDIVFEADLAYHDVAALVPIL